MLYWDPSPEMFHWNIPLLGRPVLWYGFFFALGFYLSYRVLLSLVKDKKWAESLTFYVIVGAVVGARLFDVFFYENWSHHTFFSIFEVWKGGLASHGGVIGILVASWIFQWKHRKYSWFQLLDIMVIPAGLAAGFIRIGNFVNQEILGTPTTMPWGVIFGHPADISLPIPRHPVQLYEAFFYFAMFGMMWWLRNKRKPEGRLCGLFLTCLFGFRFFIEFFKEEQSAWLSGPLTTGQLLSIPLVLTGLFLIWRNKFPIKRK